MLERAMWTELGLRREDLEKRPFQEVDDYITYLQLINREKQANAARQNAQQRRG